MASVYCPNCGSQFTIDLVYWSSQACFCNPSCKTQFQAKHKVAKADYAQAKAKKPAKRQLRIAELTYQEELDTLIENLRQLPDLDVDRYQVPTHIFGGYAPGEGLEFPIATLDSDSVRVFREFGLSNVIAACTSLLGDSVPTRRVSRPDWAYIFGAKKVSP